jgi:signal transduction histidine kinase
MDQSVQKRIFEAFFTTKEETGTGLGLWVSEEIVRKHKGLIHLRSRPIGGERNSGTVFQIFIPDDPSLSAANTPAVTGAGQTAGQTLTSVPLQ